MGCHYFNTPFRALKLAHPVAVQASATRVLEETAPLASIVTYEYPARGEMPPVRVSWYDGGLKPPVPHEIRDRPLPEAGVLYIGDNGQHARSESVVGRGLREVRPTCRGR